MIKNLLGLILINYLCEIFVFLRLLDYSYVVSILGLKLKALSWSLANIRNHSAITLKLHIVERSWWFSVLIDKLLRLVVILYYFCFILICFIMNLILLSWFTLFYLLSSFISLQVEHKSIWLQIDWISILIYELFISIATLHISQCWISSWRLRFFCVFSVTSSWWTNWSSCWG